jgi:hypothetical protein
VINYYAKDASDTTKAAITVMDSNKKIIRTFTTDDKDNKMEL